MKMNLMNKAKGLVPRNRQVKRVTASLESTPKGFNSAKELSANQVSKKTTSFLMYKRSIPYAAILFVLLLFLEWLDVRLSLFYRSPMIYTGFIAIIFTTAGALIAWKLLKTKEKNAPEPAAYSSMDQFFNRSTAAISQLQISKREIQILDLLAQGYTNDQIAATLVISLNTVKTHNQHLFEKLGVKRRMQAIDKARRLQLIP